MNTKVKCKKCEGIMDITKAIKKNVKLLATDESITVTLVVCEHCKEAHVVQIDNADTQARLKEIMHDIVKAKVLNDSGKKANAKSVKCMRNKSDLLDKKRKELAEKFKDLSCSDEVGTIIALTVVTLESCE